MAYAPALGEKGKNVEHDLVTYSWKKAMWYAFYFSLLSAFRIGLHDIKLETC